MGLDITAWSKMQHVGRHVPDDEYCEDEEHWAAHAYKGFERSVRGLKGMTEDGTNPDFIGGDCYAETVQSESHDFRAGSYGGYNRWRDDLARIAGFSSAEDYWPGGSAGEDAPFYELIWFADNEGTIGPEAAADLLKDFRDFADKAQEFWSDEYDLERYADWTTAMELAADGGLVSFH